MSPSDDRQLLSLSLCPSLHSFCCDSDLHVVATAVAQCGSRTAVSLFHRKKQRKDRRIGEGAVNISECRASEERRVEASDCDKRREERRGANEPATESSDRVNQSEQL